MADLSQTLLHSVRVSDKFASNLRLRCSDQAGQTCLGYKICFEGNFMHIIKVRKDNKIYLLATDSFKTGGGIVAVYIVD